MGDFRTWVLDPLDQLFDGHETHMIHGLTHGRQSDEFGKFDVVESDDGNMLSVIGHGFDRAKRLDVGTAEARIRQNGFFEQLDHGFIAILFGESVAIVFGSGHDQRIVNHPPHVFQGSAEASGSVVGRFGTRVGGDHRDAGMTLFDEVLGGHVGSLDAVYTHRVEHGVIIIDQHNGNIHPFEAGHIVVGEVDGDDHIPFGGSAFHHVFDLLFQAGTHFHIVDIEIVIVGLDLILHACEHFHEEVIR